MLLLKIAKYISFSSLSRKDISPGNHGKCFPDLKMKIVLLAFLPGGISEQRYKIAI